MKSKDIKDNSYLDEECIKCKHFLCKCQGRTERKAIPCLRYEEKVKDGDK